MQPGSTRKFLGQTGCQCNCPGSYSLVTRWLAGVQPAGPASRSPGGLQPGGFAQRFTCPHLLGGRVSAAGAAGTPTGGSFVLLAGCLCAVSAPFCSWRSFFLRWRLDGCHLGNVELGGGVFWITSRGFAGWASVSTCFWADPDISLAWSFPASFSDCLPVCLLPLRFLFTVVHSSCDSGTAHVFE